LQKKIAGSHEERNYNSWNGYLILKIKEEPEFESLNPGKNIHQLHLRVLITSNFIVVIQEQIHQFIISCSSVFISVQT
jgi:hypothetical protein